MPPQLPELLHGPYAAPPVRVGDTLHDEQLGNVVVGGLHNAPIPWPYVKAPGRRKLILCGDLARAVRMEAALVVRAWWNVGTTTAWKWRRALGVDQGSPGTAERKAAPKRGVPRPEHVKALLDWTGRKHSDETKRRIGEAAKRREAPPPGGPAWTADEDALLDLHDDAEVARLTGRTELAAYTRRRRRGKLRS